MTTVEVRGIVVDSMSLFRITSVSMCIFPDVSGQEEKWFCLEVSACIHLFGGFL